VGHDAAEFLRPDLEALGLEFCPDTAVLPHGAFDVVLCHHTLEHVSAPAAVLLEIKRLLRRGGSLLLAVPFEHERRYQRFDPAEPNHHLFSWNAQTLGNLVTACGFELRELRLRRYGYECFAAKLAVRLRAGERGFRLLRALAQTLRPLHEISVRAVV
jgi:SAM-dependent methyltransferase